MNNNNAIEKGAKRNDFLCPTRRFQSPELDQTGYPPAKPVKTIFRHATHLIFGKKNWYNPCVIATMPDRGKKRRRKSKSDCIIIKMLYYFLSKTTPIQILI